MFTIEKTYLLQEYLPVFSLTRMSKDSFKYNDYPFLSSYSIRDEEARKLEMVKCIKYIYKRRKIVENLMREDGK